MMFSTDAIAALMILGSTILVFPNEPMDQNSNKGPYKVTGIFHVGGSGRYDYITVDADNKLLYVPRTTHTMVVSEVDGKTINDIPGQAGNHGVAIVQNAGRGFISDGRDSSVTVFDSKTQAVLGKVKAEEDADAIFFDSASGKVFVGCGDAGDLVPISPNVDVKTGKADTPIKLGGKPESFAADGKGKVFVALEDKDQIAVVDTKAMKVIATWPVTPGGAPVGVAIDRDNGRLYVGCRKPQKFVVMSTESGKVLADLDIGAGCDSARFDNGYAFASCRDGTLAVAKETSPGKFAVVQMLKTKPGAKTLDVDAKTHKLYLPTAEFLEPSSGQRRPDMKPDSFMIIVVEPNDEH